MAPDTQSNDCNRTFLTLGLALSRPFDSSIDDPEYTGSEALSAAIKRVDLDDDDEDDADEDDEDDFNEEAEDEDDEDEDFDDDDDEEEDDDLDDDEEDEIDEDENDDDIKLI